MRNNKNEFSFNIEKKIRFNLPASGQTRRCWRGKSSCCPPPNPQAWGQAPPAAAAAPPSLQIMTLWVRQIILLSSSRSSGLRPGSPVATAVDNYRRIIKSVRQIILLSFSKTGGLGSYLIIPEYHPARTLPTLCRPDFEHQCWENTH